MTIWPFLMGIPAVVLVLGAVASVLADGPHFAPLIVCLPGAAILGTLSYKIAKQERAEAEREKRLF